MERDSFISQYVAAFLAANAVQRYNNNISGRWDWVYDQPINDAMYVAEQAWASIEKLVKQSTSGTIGNAARATVETVSLPIMSLKPGSVDPTLSTTSSPSAGDVMEPTTTGI